MAESAGVLILLVVALGLACALWGARRALRVDPREPAVERARAEAAVEARSGRATRIPVAGALAASLTLLLASALAVLVPWALVAGRAGAAAPLLAIVVPCAVGFVYASRRGAFSW